MARVRRYLGLTILLLLEVAIGRAAERAVSVVSVPEAPSVSDPVELTGTIRREPFFGPPGYGDTPDQDRRETALILRLEPPICVTREPASPCLERGIVHEIQLVWTQALGPWPPEGECIRTRGHLFRAFSAHHRRGLLLDVTKAMRCGR